MIHWFDRVLWIFNVNFFPIRTRISISTNGRQVPADRRERSLNRKFISKTSLLTPVVKDFRTGETGELGLNISGTRTQIYSAPTRHSHGIPSSLFLYLVLERALPLRHSARQGYFLRLPFFPSLSLFMHPFLTIYCWYCWRESIYSKALIWVGWVRSQQASVTTWWD